MTGLVNGGAGSGTQAVERTGGSQLGRCHGRRRPWNVREAARSQLGRCHGRSELPQAEMCDEGHWERMILQRERAGEWSVNRNRLKGESATVYRLRQHQ